MEYQEFC
ncbi:unnamed protein product, partial [Rhizophagus irregularis]